MFILEPKIYKLPPKMYILGPKIDILAPEMYILTPEMYILMLKMYLFKRYSPSDSLGTFGYKYFFNCIMVKSKANAHALNLCLCQ